MKDEFLLEVKDLHVSVGKKEILKGVDLQLRKGEVHAIFGPNGSGKTTLVNAVMGFAGYTVKGEILFSGKDITHLPVDERARIGIGMSFQRPPAIRGVKLRRLIETSAKRDGKFLEEYAKGLNLTDFLDREVNVGFSGEYTNHLLGRKREPNREKTMKELYRERRKSGLIITHTGHILDYVNVDVGYILMQGRITCQANPRDILFTIRECGFEECNRCCRGEEPSVKRKKA
jgi:Fe-S cluster assembly ATP-binding protein